MRDAFAKDPFIREIEAIPSVYLEPGGGFANIDRIAALWRLDAIALVSYDQVQHADASALSSDPKVKLVLPPGYNPNAERPGHAQPPAPAPGK